MKQFFILILVLTLNIGNAQTIPMEFPKNTRTWETTLTSEYCWKIDSTISRASFFSHSKQFYAITAFNRAELTLPVWNEYWKIYDSVSRIGIIDSYKFKGGFLNGNFSGIGNPFPDSVGNALNFTLCKNWDIYTEWLEMDVTYHFTISGNNHFYGFRINKDKFEAFHFILPVK